MLRLLRLLLLRIRSIRLYALFIKTKLYKFDKRLASETPLVNHIHYFCMIFYNTLFLCYSQYPAISWISILISNFILTLLFGILISGYHKTAIIAPCVLFVLIKNPEWLWFIRNVLKFTIFIITDTIIDIIDILRSIFGDTIIDILRSIFGDIIDTIIDIIRSIFGG